MDKVEILIADDHELVRKGLVSILAASHPEWKIVAEVANGNDAIEQGELLRPNVAIVDLSMPGPNGLRVAERLLESVPGIRILILTMHVAAPILHQLKKAGVHAYLAKNEAPRELVAAVERILAGDLFFASLGASRLVDEIEPAEWVPVQFLLTRRELEVMRLLALGQSNKELANQLHMSVRTAESHHASILAKLGIQSLGELTRIAIRDGVS
jgi:DNA-binding NarL/FixJ family response regulator